MLALFFLSSCGKKKNDSLTKPVDGDMQARSVTVEGIDMLSIPRGIKLQPTFRVVFTSPVNRSSIEQYLQLTDSKGRKIELNYTFDSSDSIVSMKPSTKIPGLDSFHLSLGSSIRSVSGQNLSNPGERIYMSGIDSADKYPRITDEALLDSIQRRSLAFFWEFGHPVSGMARERNSSGDIVTTGGTGFGIMAMVACANRGLISRTETRDRITKIVRFLRDRCISYHGAFAHWINGSNGSTIPFSANDNGGDLVETSYLLAGLLTARQYFSGSDQAEIALRDQINAIWDGVEWNWFRQNQQDVLYWHWSADLGWAMNMKVQGWNEALIVYALAASSNADPISLPVYQNGWAGNGAMRNGQIYFGQTLPLGPPNGGPLFWSHYSFLGIDPNGLYDTYADYGLQVKSHSKINRSYCMANPQGHFGYSGLCWGLTASDVPGGYNANEPGNDPGVISPTAALSSLAYTPKESMETLRFFYYTLGDKLWKPYGFIDAFRLNDLWFADSFLAIDQGPIIVMIENYRTGLIWNLFMSCPEIKRGLRNLGFQGPRL